MVTKNKIRRQVEMETLSRFGVVTGSGAMSLRPSDRRHASPRTGSAAPARGQALIAPASP